SWVSYPVPAMSRARPRRGTAAPPRRAATEGLGAGGSARRGGGHRAEMDPIRPEVEGGGPGAHANRRDRVEPPMERRSATGAEGTERSSRGLVLANKVPAI